MNDTVTIATYGYVNTNIYTEQTGANCSVMSVHTRQERLQWSMISLVFYYGSIAHRQKVYMHTQ